MSAESADLNSLLSGLVGFFTYTRDARGEFTSVDPRVEKILGYSPAEFQSSWRSLPTTNMNEKPAQARFLFENASPDESIYDIEVRAGDERPVWLRIHESFRLGGGGKIESVSGLALDWTEHKLHENRMRISEERFRGMNQSSPVGVFQVDADDFYVYLNPSWERITGYSIVGMLGKPWWHIIYPEDQEKAFKQWADAERNEGELQLECRIIKPDNSIRWVQLNTKFMFFDRGKETIGILQDISERVEANIRQDRLIHKLLEMQNQLEELARTDTLTKLPNRRAMNEKLNEEVNRFSRTKKPFVILLMDIDYFKKINDTYGHDAGDYVLIQVANLLRGFCRKQDLICRWGGEEFMALLPETDLKGGAHFAEKLRAAIEAEPIIFGESNIRVTVSQGGSIFAEDYSQDMDQCISQADKALYKAKHEGRNRYVSAYPIK